MHGLEHSGLAVAAIAAEHDPGLRYFCREAACELEQVFLYVLVKLGFKVSFHDHAGIVRRQQVQCTLR